MCVYGVCVDLLFISKVCVMRIFLVILMAIFFAGCEKKATFGFTSSDCNEVYTNCINKCIQTNKSRAECANSCDRSRGMCEAIKVKGCMQNCNKRYGKNTMQSETCKKRCSDNRGVN